MDSMAEAAKVAAFRGSPQASEDALRFKVVRQQFRFVLPEPSSLQKSVLAFSHHKAGSTMLYGILSGLSAAAGVAFISMPRVLFSSGVDPASVDIVADFKDTGFCFGGYRSFPSTPLPLIDTAQTVLLVRDPRDVLVSHYYSVRDAHRIPDREGDLKNRLTERRLNARETTIDEWVVENQTTVVQSLAGYIAQRFGSRKNVAIYRYEDIVYRKRAWIEDMVRWYGWTVPASEIDRAVAKYDVFPSKADITKHVRQVAPGNHRTALLPATQEKLRVSLEPLLTFFGYAT
jgi:hypothetical protein